jgi:hypothetical protein
MADSAASTQSRTPRASSTKRRANTVSTETENKLARAARSAQRLAQLSDVSRDGSTLDMFPDDPTRATLEAMNIDIRQGTLHGFELPDVVLAAVGAAVSTDGPAPAASDARGTRRASREKAEVAHVAVPLAGFERVEPTVKGRAPESVLPSTGGATGVALDTLDAAPAREPRPPQTAGSASITPAMAAATVARSVTALRQAADPAAEPAATGKPGALPQRFAATFARAATASRETAAVSDDTQGNAAAATPSAAPQTRPTEADANVTPAPGTPATPRSNAPFAAPLQDAAPTAPELDRARATAFADTVDALYGVISDQRRAATDHSRRMKWMLSIVVGALLVTVAIGIAQTLLLMRLTHETTVQQHRIEQMMQNQQTAMTSLLDAHLTMANAVAAAAPAPAPATAAAPRQAAAAAPASKRKAPAHAHKPKAAPAH